jgi:hypothetical protein
MWELCNFNIQGLVIVVLSIKGQVTRGSPKFRDEQASTFGIKNREHVHFICSYLDVIFCFAVLYLWVEKVKWHLTTPNNLSTQSMQRVSATTSLLTKPYPRPMRVCINVALLLDIELYRSISVYKGFTSLNNQNKKILSKEMHILHIPYTYPKHVPNKCTITLLISNKRHTRAHRHCFSI